MADDSYVLTLIRKHIRLFSAFLFLLAVVALLILLPLEESSDGKEYEVWVKVGSEIAKGLIAASAVSFLYDWLLKLDADEQLKRIVRNAVQDGVATPRAEDVPERTLLDSFMEVVCLPLQNPTMPDSARFCTLQVHHRFRARYYGDEVRIALGTRPESVATLRDDASCIFFWKIDDAPASEPQEAWLEAKSLKVNGTLWDAAKCIEDGNIICTFKRPKQSPSAAGMLAVYEMEVTTIENCPSPLTLNFIVDRTYVRPTWRIDARAINAKSVTPTMSTPVAQLAKNWFLDAPGVTGICQVFVNDTLKPEGGFLQFLVSRHV